jgi:hypothetical protein
LRMMAELLAHAEADCIQALRLLHSHAHTFSDSSALLGTRAAPFSRPHVAGSNSQFTDDAGRSYTCTHYDVHSNSLHTRFHSPIQLLSAWPCTSGAPISSIVLVGALACDRRDQRLKLPQQQWLQRTAMVRAGVARTMIMLWTLRNYVRTWRILTPTLLRPKRPRSGCGLR